MTNQIYTKKHIDGTVCNYRKSMPQKSAIAYYWKGEKSYKYFNCFMDNGEPSCWACNTYIGDFDINLSNFNESEIFKVWDNHTYLERCHIIPQSLGGCNCEANLVLLCKKCHRKSPDNSNPHFFIIWMKQRTIIYAQELLLEMHSVNYVADKLDWKIMLSDEWLEFLKLDSVVVGGVVQYSTLYASLMNFKKKYPEIVKKIFTE